MRRIFDAIILTTCAPAFFIALFVFAPYADAWTRNYTGADFPQGGCTVGVTNPIITYTGTGQICYDNGSGTQFTPGATVYFTFTGSMSPAAKIAIQDDTAGANWYDFTSGATDIPIVVPSGTSWNSAAVWDNNAAVGTLDTLCISDTIGACSGPPPPPPPPSSSLDAAIAVATSSFAANYGFDMDAVSIWMWDNLGQPILGSGIGVLVVMRWYWLGFVAIGIIVLFAFAYFRFFKR